MNDASDPPVPDSVESFARDLRRLRLDAANPTLARLHHDTGISRSVLSEAFSGRSLPSRRTVDALAHALDVDAEALLDRRDQLAGSVRPPTGEVRAAEPEASSLHTVSRRLAIVVAVGAFVLGAGSSATASWVMGQSSAIATPVATATDGPRIHVDSGVDPAKTPCLDDAKVAASEMRANGMALLQIIWSDRCQAGWGRITRYDGKAEGNTVTVSIFPETAPDGPLRQTAVEHDVQGAYTTLVVRPSEATRLCVAGIFTTAGAVKYLGRPFCT